MVFVAYSQGLLRRPRYSRLLRKDVREGFDRYPFGEDGIQANMRATGKFVPLTPFHFLPPETLHFVWSN